MPRGVRSEDNVPEYVTAIEVEGGRAAALPLGRRVARLSVLLGRDEGTTYQLGSDGTIGRGADSTVRLPDRGVSRHHARIKQLPNGQFSIEDLGSRNGTLVNGHAMTKCQLESGARIQLGPRCLLLFSLHDDLEESLLQSKKVEIIGRLSAGINHDFNNLLCVILSNAAYLLELPRDLPLGHTEVRECLEDMRAAAQAGAEVTHRLGTLAQSGTMAQETIDFSMLCHETIEVLRGTFPKSVRIAAHVQPAICVRGIRSHLRQLLLNPCLNARDAMLEGGGTLSIELVVKTVEELETMPMLRASYYAVVTFTDTGRGMTPEVLGSAFEPFFTTKAIDLGRGLGLAAVRKVASDHGGTVELKSELGVGTRLRLVLPVEDVDARRVEDKASLLAVAGSSATAQPDPKTANANASTSESLIRPAEADAPRRSVLLAEGDEALGRTFARSLRRAGYDVVWTANAADALDSVRHADAAFDVILLDLDDAGIAAGEPELRAANSAPIIGLCSAPDLHDAVTLASYGPDRILRKPLDPAVLVRVVSLAVRQAERTSS
jgi:signal transduction histidine kinase/ActR/RegA family two-component response regulator